MTDDPVWKERVVRLSSAWLDGTDGRPSEAADGPAQLPDDAAHYLADLLWVDALMSTLSPGAAGAREARIKRVMQALDEPAHAPPRRARLVRWSSVAAAAAVLLFALTASWVQLGRKSLADDVLLAVNEVSSEETDRVYAIERVLTAGTDNGRRGKLYLRGRRGFVIAIDQATLGRDSDQFWVVAPPRQVFLSTDFQWIDARTTQDQVGLRFMQQLSLESRHIPLMQLASVAELMRFDYDVTLSSGQLADHTMDLLVGKRRSDRPDLPAVIRLWSDVESRIVQRAELSWEPENALLLELLPAETVPDGWYGYQAHCQGEPVIRRIGHAQ